MNRRMLTVGSLILKEAVTDSVVQTKCLDFSERKILSADLTPKVFVLQNGQSFPIRSVKGRLLLDAALEQGQAIQYKCRKGTCGQCLVKIDAGSSFLQSPNELELKKLKSSLSEGFRLACQVEFRL
ncbi:2Fe-2S iron-sulfur cluster binding domain-containing protein [Bacillus sp. DTU_2020_1000418_1_SI_GHA_SEK_038]|uniref:2Fe-2S iron-sulfur cluster-binding protein n=1 Tax=Bacillus sp. DTU_2020_1000418_1_SI_GHA_SEK_038 TaxID=3077585 RepID=UPI0028EC84E6|nr:2Fe-2S iron-sulfur cluster binding domain-containing protein [Bacillus sp. DTU_2020_1000418_1_SI_GHA_SEK_038]WNS74908.1 2Fe-2S iron-sulfur cluster binding domain-containing protein [Bacillus sp. DTU_2020_1000418_1_SI_GHA_SEK_038]